jgi:large subunit ribosomal protein L22
MTPSKPGNPSQGKPAEAEKAGVEAAEAKQAAAVEGAQEKAQAPAPDVEETPEAQASDELDPTAADEAAADAAAEEEEDDVLTDEPDPEAEADDAPEAEEASAGDEQPKPRRRSRAKKSQTPAPKPARERVAPGERVLVRAQAKYVRTSARKARLVCDHIRGKSVLEARAILALTPRHVARDWSKLLESAVANAENNHELIGDELRIASVTADEGPTLKRYRPRAMGRATRIRKRTSHLTILLTPKES